MSIYQSYLKIINEGIHSHQIDREIFKRDVLKGRKDLDIDDGDLGDPDNWDHYVKNGKIKSIKRYLKNGFDPSYNKNAAIKNASYYGHTEIVKLLLNDPRVNPSANDNYAINAASYHGYIEIVKLLLNSSRIDLSDRLKNAIELASNYGHPEIVKLLSNKIMDVETWMQYIDDENIEGVKDYLKNGFNPSVEADYAIRMISRTGNVEIFKLLLADTRVNPTVFDNHPIKTALYHSNIEIFKLLLADNRIDPSFDDNIIFELIFRFESERFLEIAKMVISNSKFNYTKGINNYILEAAKANQSDIVNMFISNDKVISKLPDTVKRILKDKGYL